MRIKTQLVLFAAAITLVGVLAETAEACSCRFGGGAPCEDYWRADAVFSGMAVSSSRIPVDYGSHKSNQRLVRLTIEEAFRGITGIEAEVLTGLGGGDCGFNFKHGERYLVYAHRDSSTNRLSTGICSRTRLLAEAAEDLAYFRTLPTADPGGTIFGKVLKRNYEQSKTARPYLPIPGADLTIEGESGNQEVRSDDEGSFRVVGLKPGKYKVRLKLPKGLVGRTFVKDDSTVENDLTVEHFACAETGFYLESDTRVTGRVVNSSGDPVSSLPISMRGANANQSNVNVFLSAQTDSAGLFEFKIVPPGDYWLGFRIRMSSHAMAPYPRTYYPDVPLKAQATIISVREGNVVKDLELRLPPPLSTYEVEGWVIWPDGRPVPGAHVYLSLSEEGDSTTLDSPRTDQSGHFTLKLYEGLSYKVSAFLERPKRPGLQSPWTDVPPRNGPRSMKLILVNEMR